MDEQIDIVMLSYNRLKFTQLVISELRRRTRMPFRLIVVDDGSTDGSTEWLWEALRKGLIDRLIPLQENYGVHWAHNMGLEAVRSKPYYISTDNDIVPQNSDPDWLSQLIELMEAHPEYGAVALRAHVLIGEPGDRFKGSPPIREMSHIPAYLRIMRTELIRRVGGWERVKRPGRDNEDWYISGKIIKAGYKVGFARDIRCIHLWGDEKSPWGYPPGQSVGHREIYPPVYIYNWDRLGVDWESCRPRSSP